MDVCVGGDGSVLIFFPFLFLFFFYFFVSFEIGPYYTIVTLDCFLPELWPLPL